VREGQWIDNEFQDPNPPPATDPSPTATNPPSGLPNAYTSSVLLINDTNYDIMELELTGSWDTRWWYEDDSDVWLEAYDSVKFHSTDYPFKDYPYWYELKVTFTDENWFTFDVSDIDLYAVSEITLTVDGEDAYINYK